MSLLDWLGLKRGEGRRKEAHAKELAGDLAGAVELYLEAELPDEAARVLLLRADAERAVEKRIAFCAAAARTAAGAEVRRAALARKALLSFDVLRARGASAMRSEVLAVARDLEEAGELERAADAFALAEDPEGEVRVLTAAGAIDRLEDRLRTSMAAARGQRELDAVLRRVADLDRTAERRAALDVAERWLGQHRDERVSDAARAIRARLAAGPVVELEVRGARARYALGDALTIGRGDATIVIASRAVSRQHVRLERRGGDAFVEDLGTRNGTTLAGARISAGIRVGDGGVSLVLGGEVPCEVAPRPREGGEGGGFLVDVAGERFIAPLGDLRVGPWRLRHERVGDLSFVVLATPPGAQPPFLGDYQLAASVELCAGDAISASRSGPILLRVPGTADAPGAAGRSEDP